MSRWALSRNALSTTDTAQGPYFEGEAGSVQGQRFVGEGDVAEGQYSHGQADEARDWHFEEEAGAEHKSAGAVDPATVPVRSMFA